jgi:hypothetical protein
MSALADLFQDDILARLNADSYFADIVIIEEALGTADTAVRKALGGELPKASKFGAFIIIELPEMDPEDNVRGKYTVRTRLHVRVIPKFNNGTNGTGKSLSEIANRVSQNLHLFPRNSQTWIVEKWLPYSDDAGTIGFEIIVSWAGTGEEILAWCGTVNITTAATNTLATLALNAAGTGYAPGDTITLAGGTFTTASTLTVSTTKVVSASLVSAGDGFAPTGIPATIVMSGTTGTGTRVRLSVGVDASGVIGTVSVSGFGTNSGGSYTANPSNLSAEPLTHGSLLGAAPTVSLTMGVATFAIAGAGSYTDTGTTAFTQGSTSGGGSGATFQSATFTAASLVTLATGTSGASIYYTTDGTFPRSGNGTLYSAPFTATSGSAICAQAFKTGLLGSGITRKTV